LGSHRTLLATNNSINAGTSLIQDIHNQLGTRIVAVFPNCREHAPSSSVETLVGRVEGSAPDTVVSLGGSSVIDCVKAAVFRFTQVSPQTPIYHIAIPTTLSGSEFTAGAGITDETDHSKQLVTDHRLLPRAVILDPEVTVYTPDRLWTSTGIKAIEHAVEAIWAHNSHPYVETLALESIRLLVGNLERSREPEDLEARSACQIGSWMSMAGNSTSGIRLSHFLGHQIGARWDIPHGITACVLLPSAMRYLAPATLHAQKRIAGAMGVMGQSDDPQEIAASAVDRLEHLIAALGLPTRLGDAGGRLDDLPSVAAAGYQAAKTLRLTADLPDGELSVCQLLEMAW
jgi:alcohol dehydrogenase class IV